MMTPRGAPKRQRLAHSECSEPTYNGIYPDGHPRGPTAYMGLHPDDDPSGSPLKDGELPQPDALSQPIMGYPLMAARVVL